MFVPLHVPSVLAGGVIAPQEFGHAARRLGYPAIAITDPFMFGLSEFLKGCEAEGVKPIIGCELALLPENAEGSRRGSPFVLLARNLEGFHNLLRLVSLRHDGTMGHVTLSDCDAHAKGLMALTGGPRGMVDQLLDQADIKGAWDTLGHLRDIFQAENTFIEIQPDTRASNHGEFARQCLSQGLSRVATAPMLLTMEELEAVFCSEAMERTLEIASRVERFATHRRPWVPFRKGAPKGPAKDELTTRARQGLERRLGEASIYGKGDDARGPEAYRIRLEEELSQLTANDLEECAEHLLGWAKVVETAARQGVQLGVGVGSVLSSLVGYSLGLHEIDPLRFDLPFLRFHDPERFNIHQPWIDISHEGLDRMLAGLQEAFEGQLVAEISDVDPALKMPVEVSKLVPKLLVPAGPYMLSHVHIAPLLAPLPTWQPEGASMLALQAIGADSGLFGTFGIFLAHDPSLETFQRLQADAKAIGIPVDEAMGLDDEHVYARLRAGDLDGIPGLSDIELVPRLRAVQPEHFDDVVAALSMRRENQKPLFQAFLDARHSPSGRADQPAWLAPLLARSRGVLLYEEQITALVSFLGLKGHWPTRIRLGLTRRDPCTHADLLKELICSGIAMGFLTEELEALRSQLLTQGPLCSMLCHDTGRAFYISQSVWLNMSLERALLDRKKVEKAVPFSH